MLDTNITSLFHFFKKFLAYFFFIEYSIASSASVMKRLILISISGMSMIAERYHDDKERSRAMGFAMGGLALGILGEHCLIHL